MNLKCPYCNHATTITAPNMDRGWIRIDIEGKMFKNEKRVGLRYEAIACPNQECKNLFLKIALTHLNAVYGEGELVKQWQLLPESNAKPQPDYIPAQIVQDYTEACKILLLSPKASATLSRRCLQGMICDFWEIKKGTLGTQIKSLQTRVSEDTWKSIDGIRSIGNIGAHMEKNVNEIIDIEPDEAELLIKLIEDLLVDWYVAKYEQSKRQQKISEIVRQKKQLKSKDPS